MTTLDVDVHCRFASGFSLAATFRSEARATALFGPSGAGKTSILNAIAGLLRPDAGRIVVGGATLFDAETRRFVPPRRRRIGYVFQEHRLFPHLDVARNLRFGMPRNGSVSFSAVVNALELDDLLERRPQTLSGGQQQRVAIGRALLASPQLILLDEPLSSLDDERRGRILDFLERLLESFSVPLVFVSHSQTEVRRLAERVILLDGGAVVDQGTSEDVWTRRSALELDHESGLVNLLKLDSVTEVGGRLIGTIGSMVLSLPTPPYGSPTRYIAVEPSSVTLAADDVQGVSTRNHLPGVVATIVESRGRVFVAVDVGRTLWAEITQSALAEMKLAVGTRVFCLLKTQSMKFV